MSKGRKDGERGPGRPTKLTPEVARTIADYVKAGNYIETAAAAAGISKQTLYSWMKAGARATAGPHREFLDAVEKAQAESEVTDVLRISVAAKSQWQAAAWRLERKNPDRWGRKDRQEPHEVKVVGAKGGAVEMKHEVEGGSPERIAGILDVLRRAGALDVVGGLRSPDGGDDAPADGLDSAPPDDSAGGVPSP